jgi:hypothetical protein
LCRRAVEEATGVAAMRAKQIIFAPRLARRTSLIAIS